jgi:hypothetical protein
LALFSSWNSTSFLSCRSAILSPLVSELMNNSFANLQKLKISYNKHKCPIQGNKQV